MIRCIRCHFMRRADALVCMAESFLATGAGALAGGERYQVMVHVDADTLPADGAGLRCELEDGPGVSSETARRLACAASRVCVHEDAEGNLLDIGRRSRQIPPAIARALRLRDGHGGVGVAGAAVRSLAVLGSSPCCEAM